ncbi:hypothetical protein BASA81_010351 [Batrachochytrium salamandrivorans]|nr:hypothetical protein BASA81_010351 [Batrachochytrium salamandrivorans]
MKHYHESLAHLKYGSIIDLITSVLVARHEERISRIIFPDAQNVQLNRSASRNHAPSNQTVPPVALPFERWGIDFYGPMVETKWQNLEEVGQARSAANVRTKAQAEACEKQNGFDENTRILLQSWRYGEDETPRSTKLEFNWKDLTMLSMLASRNLLDYDSRRVFDFQTLLTRPILHHGWLQYRQC